MCSLIKLNYWSNTGAWYFWFLKGEKGFSHNVIWCHFFSPYLERSGICSMPFLTPFCSEKWCKSWKESQSLQLSLAWMEQRLLQGTKRRKRRGRRRKKRGGRRNGTPFRTYSGKWNPSSIVCFVLGTFQLSSHMLECCRIELKTSTRG